jgi:hypothetical protein
MPVMRFWPCSGTQRVTLMACSARAQSVAALRDVFIHRDEPLRRVAEDDRLLRAPGMRVLMLEAAGRDQHPGLFERFDDSLIGVALLALVVDNALAREARRLLGERAVLVDGVGDGGIDPARFQHRAIGGPHVEVFAAMAGRGVHEAGAIRICDVVTG